jgi:hypothetical protein
MVNSVYTFYNQDLYLHNFAVNALSEEIGLILSSEKLAGKINVYAESTVASGDMEILRKLIENRVDLNQGDYDFRTAMHMVIVKLAN